jgi:hypothetical protein
MNPILRVSNSRTLPPVDVFASQSAPLPEARNAAIAKPSPPRHFRSKCSRVGLDRRHSAPAIEPKIAILQKKAETKHVILPDDGLNTTIPFLGNVLCEASGNKITLTATDIRPVARRVLTTQGSHDALISSSVAHLARFARALPFADSFSSAFVCSFKNHDASLDLFSNVIRLPSSSLKSLSLSLSLKSTVWISSRSSAAKDWSSAPNTSRRAQSLIPMSIASLIAYQCGCWGIEDLGFRFVGCRIPQKEVRVCEIQESDVAEALDLQLNRSKTYTHGWRRRGFSIYERWEFSSRAS